MAQKKTLRQRTMAGPGIQALAGRERTVYGVGQPTHGICHCGDLPLKIIALTEAKRGMAFGELSRGAGRLHGSNENWSNSYVCF